jgi:6-phosphogluconolactonase
MKYTLTLLCLLLSAALFAQKKYYLLAGTYTQGKSTGIYVYDFDSRTGSARVVDSVRTANPSYLEVAPNQHDIYAVNENNDGEIKAFSFNNSNGHLRPLNTQPSMGANPCYVTIDRTGKWAFVGNYSSGTLAELPIRSDGTLGAPAKQVAHQGHGVNKDRQEGPHVHATVLAPDNQWLFVPDLGIDTLKAYSFDAKTGALQSSKARSVKLPDGAGPRHFVFHPNGKWAYLVQEMGGKVTVFNYSKGTLTNIQSISTLPKDFTGSFTSADIHVSPDGRFLYASNRDVSNTIAIFRINQQVGRLTAIGHQSTLGRTPRNFNFDPSGNYLLVANQNTDDVVIFSIDHRTGLLHDTGNRIQVGNPVCLKWISKN